MDPQSLSDQLLLLKIALVNAEYEVAPITADLDDRSAALNAEGARRWGTQVMDDLAEYVTRHHMTGLEFALWACNEGAGWLRRAPLREAAARG